MDIIELIKKVENISKKIEGKDATESRLIMVDEIIKYLGGNCLCKLIESGVCQIKIRLI